MSEDSRDKTDHDLFRPAIERLYQQPLHELGGEHCRDMLKDILEGRWFDLVAESCRRFERPIPDNQDAMLAFDSIKHTLLGDIHVLELSLPEVWRLLRRIRLKYWIGSASASLAILGAVATAAYEIGKLMGK